jgi:hypothetical protein
MLYFPAKFRKKKVNGATIRPKAAAAARRARGGWHAWPPGAIDL